MSKLVRLGKLLLKHRWLINRNNVDKAYKYLKNGELIAGIKRIYRKLEAFDAKVSTTEEIYFLNACLYGNEIKTVEEKADIIIPIYNAYEYTVKCIESVYKNTDSPYDLYLINDCSSDERISAYLQGLKSQAKPECMGELVILEHDENKGFIATVNEGFAAASHHVVILNTDTEVPKGWLTRLLQPIMADRRVASVTPFSNCATICSFPNFCQDNVLPEGISLDELDNLFSLYGSDEVIEIPTGVGFCMALNSACLEEIGSFDTIFGKGYCEENDWCRRAVTAGYRNVMITNLFVYHKHGASFGEIVTKSKQERIDENLRLLLKRYPDYQTAVDDIIARDPVKDIRNFMKLVIACHTDKAHQIVLAVNHSMGGGATVYLQRKMESESDKIFLVMELLADRKTLHVKSFNIDVEGDFYFDFGRLDSQFIKRLADCLNIKSIFVNQLVDYPIEDITDMISKSGLPYDFIVHDFYCVCPRYNLLNESYEYCHAEKEAVACNECLKSHLVYNDIEAWRNRFGDFLKKAESVVTPSNDTSAIVNGYYPAVNIKTMEHEIPAHIQKTYDEKFEQNDILRVSVLGAIGIEKGSRILDDLVKKIADKKLPIKITVIGYTDKCDKPCTSKDGMFEITGRYDNREVSALLAKHKTNIVLIPSIWPETYSYTVSEAIYSGYKVMAFDIGAPSERIRKMEMGWLVKDINAEALLAELTSILADRK